MINSIVGGLVKFTELLLPFPYWKINFRVADLGEYASSSNLKDLAIKTLFIEQLKLIIRDLIKYNGTFHLPVSSVASGDLKIVETNNSTLKSQIKRHKREKLDVFASQFKGYNIRLKCYNRGLSTEAYVFADREISEAIDKATSSGKCYDGDSKYDFYLSDYVDELHNMFPKISKEDITFTLKYSWKMLYLHIRGKCNIIIRNRGFSLLFINQKYYKDFYKKYSYNLNNRIFTLLKSMNWDNTEYLYFYLSRQLKELYHNDITGEKGHVFENLYVCTNLDLCKCNSVHGTYIYRVKNDMKDIEFYRYVKNYLVKNAELLEVPETRKQRILVWNGKYEVFKQAQTYRNHERDPRVTPVVGYLENGKIIGTYINMYEAADATGAKRPNIWYTCEGKRESAGKYKGKKIKWRYLDKSEMDEFYKKRMHEKKLDYEQVQ